MFKVRDDSKIYEWRAKLEAQRRKFASLEEMQGQNGGARHLCIPSSGQFSGAYAEEGYKGDTTYALSFEPGRGCSVKISGSVSDNDGQARIQDGEILPSGDCFWIEKSRPGSIEPPTKRKMTPGNKSTDVSDEEATTLMALVVARYDKAEGKIVGGYFANTGVGGTMWCVCGPPTASPVSIEVLAPANTSSSPSRQNGMACTQPTQQSTANQHVGRIPSPFLAVFISI